MVDARGLLGEKRRIVEGGADGDPQPKAFRPGGERRGRRPRVERRGVNALDVVEIEFGNQRQVIADLFAAPREAADIIPPRLHPLVFNVSQPTTENREPVTVAHLSASSSRKSTRRT